MSFTKCEWCREYGEVRVCDTCSDQRTNEAREHGAKYERERVVAFVRGCIRDECSPSYIAEAIENGKHWAEVRR